MLIKMTDIIDFISRYLLAKACLVVWLLLCFFASTIAQAETVTQYPSNGLTIKTNQATSGILELEFTCDEPITLPETKNTLSAIYQLAGDPNQIPTFKVKSIEFARFANDDTFRGVDKYTPVNNEFPANTIRLTKSGVLRQFQLYTLALPLQYIKSVAGQSEQELLSLRSLRLEINIGMPSQQTEDYLSKAKEFSDTEGAHPDSILGSQVLNPNIDSAFALIDSNLNNWNKQKLWAQTVNDAIDANSTVLKYKIEKPGLYQFSPKTTQAKVKQEDVETWGFYCDGERLPAYRLGDKSLVVQVSDFDVVQEGYKTLWLISPDGAKTTTSSATKFISPYSAPTSADLRTTTSSSVFTDFAYEKLHGYHPRLTANSDVCRWFWQAVNDEKTSVFTFDLPVGFAANGNTTTTLTVYAQAPDPLSESASIRISLNGHYLPNKVFSSSTRTIDLAIPSDYLTSGKNTLTMRLNFSVAPTNKSDMLVQKMIVHCSQFCDQLLHASKEQIPFTLEPQSTTFTLSTKSLDAIDTSSLVIASLEKPFRIFAPTQTTNTLLFDIGAPTNNKYCFINDNLYLPPVPTSVNRLSLFDLSTGFDTIYISPLDLQAELKTLANQRMQQGWKILMVDCETVYDHFSYGNRSPEGIHEFLKWCYLNLPAPKVQNVLLAGEASDFKLLSRDKEQSAFGSDNLPVAGGPRSIEARGDHEYGLVSGNDMFTDLCVGRISVNNSEELRNVIEKILHYEMIPPKPWLLNTIFTYDDNDEFPQIVSDVMKFGTIPYENCIRIPQSDYYYLPNSKVTYRKRAYGATEAIIKAFNNGASLINYFGHGAPNLWSHERMLQLSDLKLLTNREELPFITCSSCDNAWLDYPMAPVQSSMGEEFLKCTNGGGISVFAPVSGASPYEHKVLMSHLNDAVWHQGIRSFGHIIAYAKNLYHAQSNSSSLPRQYILIGDPELSLKLPTPQIDQQKFSIEPSIVLANTTTTINVHANLANDQPFHIKVSSNSGQIIKDIVIPKSFPNYDFEITLPPLPAGKHGITLIQTQPSGEINEFLLAPLCSDNAYVHLSVDTNDDAPKPICLGDGEVSSFTLCITNHSNLPISQGILHVTRSSLENETNGNITEIGSADISLAPDETIKVNIPVTVPSQQYIAYLSHPSANISPSPSVRIPVYKKSENSTAADIHILPVPEYTTINPESPDATDHIRIKAGFINTGNTAVTSASVQVCLDSEIICSSQTIHTLNPYDVGNAFLALTSPLPVGKHDLDIVLLSNADASTITQCKLPVEISANTAPHFVAGSVRMWSQRGTNTAQETMFVSARVRNGGSKPAKNISICIVKDDPIDGAVQNSINDTSQLTIKSIAPNETTNFVYRWENYSWTDESQNYYLVLNKNEQKHGKLSNDTWTTLPFVRSNNLGDFAIDSFYLSTNIARPDTPITLRATLSYDGDRPINNISVQCASSSSDGDELTNNFVVPTLDKDRKVEFVKTITAKLGHPLIKLSINANREISESNPTNNNRIIPLSLLFSENEMKSLDSHTYSFENMFDSFVLESIEYIPGIGFSIQDKFTSSTGVMEMKQEYVTSDNIETSSALYHFDKEDELWLVLPWLARAWTNENAGDLSLKIPIGEDNDSLLYEAKVLVSAGMDYEGMPVGSLQSKLNPDDKFVRHDPVNLKQTVQDTWISLGKTKLVDGCFTPTFKQVGDASTLIKAFELIPIQAIMQTPAIEFDHDCSVTLSVKQDFDDTNNIVQYRDGQLQPDGNIMWSSWADTSVENPVSVTMDRPIIQWRIVIRQTTNMKQGTVKSITLKELATE